MPRPPIHPGDILAAELAELEMSAAQLSRELHVPTNRVTQILAGKRGITADTALRLGTWFGTGPELWLNLQKSYELRLAEQEVAREIRNTITTRHATGHAAREACGHNRRAKQRSRDYHWVGNTASSLAGDLTAAPEASLSWPLCAVGISTWQ